MWTRIAIIVTLVVLGLVGLMVLGFYGIEYVFSKVYPEGVTSSDCYDAEFNLQPCYCVDHPTDGWCVSWREEMRDHCSKPLEERPYDYNCP